MLFSEVYTKFGGYYYIAVPLQPKTTKNNSLSPNPSPRGREKITKRPLNGIRINRKW